MSNSERYNLDALNRYIKNNNIDIATIPPALLGDKNCSLNLDILVVAGERSEKKTLDYYLQSNTKIINAYGPTEITVCSSLNHYKGNNNISIGTPISNTKAYVFSSDLAPLPIGAIGELYIGGVGLARGYLNQPDLTNERFIPNPFQTEAERRDKTYGTNGRNSRLYKTGDLVRWLPDGNLDYIGRNDFQVKIRGFRIELGEIESALLGYDGVQQSVVIAREHKIGGDEGDIGSKYLVGYYTSTSKHLDEESILLYLATKLPDYMIPTALVYLDKLPLTINGKLDRRALPDVEFGSNGGNSYVAPRDELESKICAIFAEVLGLDIKVVGIRDDFFRMGGDSIISIQLVSRLRQRLSIVSVTIKDIFTYRTVGKLYDNVIKVTLENGIEAMIVTEQGALSGNVPLLPIQEWFFNNSFIRPYHWNQSFLINTPALNVDILQVSLKALVEHHDSLRLRYTDEHVQYYDDEAQIEELKIIDVNTLTSDEELTSILTEWQSNFDIEAGPLYSLGYIYGFKDGSARVFFALHHLIVDTVSWRILSEDLKELYYKALNGDTLLSLGSKGTSYRQWVATVNNYNNLYKDEQSYWDDIVVGIEEGNTKLVSVSKSTNISSGFTLTKAFTSRLLKESSSAYNTEVNDLLLAALSLSLNDVLGTKVNYITLEGHGREEGIAKHSIDISRTIGWFTTMYPVKLKVEGDKTEEVRGAIRYTKELLRQIPNKGIGFGSIVGYDLNSLPKVSFNYLGQLDQTKDLNNSTGSWRITSENSGISTNNENEDRNIININGSVVSGELKFSVVSKLDDELHSQLINIFKSRLEEVIKHTANLPRAYLTISDVDNIIDQSYLDKIQTAREIEKVYLANNLQQGFIYHSLNQGDIDDAYLVQMVFDYRNKLDLDNLKKSWQLAQSKYPSLRLRLKWDEELVQVIDKEGKLDWRYIDLSKLNDAKEQEIQIKQIQEKDRNERYNLEAGSLFRIYIIKQKDSLYRCIFSNHHAILDGWSGFVA